MYKNKELIIRNIVSMVSSQFNSNISLAYNKHTYINGEYHIHVDLDINGEISCEIIDMKYFSLDDLYGKLMNVVKNKILEIIEKELELEKVN